MARGAILTYYTAKSVRRQAAVSSLSKSRHSLVFGATFLLALLIAAAIFYIGMHVKVVNLGYQINQELQKKEKLIEDNKRLDLEIARLKSPTRIEHEAKEKLGLVMPSAGQILYLSKLEDPAALEAVAKSLPLPPTSNPSTEKRISETGVNEIKTMGIKEEKKIAEKTEKKIVSRKVLVAKIVEGESRLKTQLAPKRKETIPAVMLDPMP